MAKKPNGGFAAIAAIMAVALAVGGGAAYYFYTQVQNLESTPKPSETAEQVTPNTEEEQGSSEKEVEADVARLEAVGDFEGSGRATRIFENGEFTHTVAANLEEPAEGKFYEGWLVTQTPELDFFSTGRLTKTNGNYTLEFTGDEEYDEYKEVVVTEETEADGLDGVPETHVLEGSF